MRPADFTVFAFSQSDVGEPGDPQVYQLDPDINIRAIGKWSTNGDEAADYDFAQIRRYHEKGISFMGSGTASVIFPETSPHPKSTTTCRPVTRTDNPVPHEEFGFPVVARRGNMFNPRYRQYLLGWAKLQVDGGVDGVTFDEVNAGFSGGLKWGFNGNEGFDDYALADFNRYLLAKYPAYTDADWKSRFAMTDDNIVRRDVAPDDLARNFNYRNYLRANGWNTNPMIGANPLVAEWGRVTANRMYADDMSFTATYLRRYWKELVDELRAYARRTAHRQILDQLQRPDPLRGLQQRRYVPVESRRADTGLPRRGLRAGRRRPPQRGQVTAGQLPVPQGQERADLGPGTPVVVFIDWPNDMMTNYLNLPLQEKKDYWQIFGAEAYANGLFPAFHLRDTVGSPTAEQLGTLEFYRTYSRFFREHRDLFRDNDIGTPAVRVGTANVSASLLVQRGTAARTLHLVNHNYDQGIVPQTGLTVEVDLDSCPRRVSMVSPDFAGSKTPASSCRHGKLQRDRRPDRLLQCTGTEVSHFR